MTFLKAREVEIVPDYEFICSQRVEILYFPFLCYNEKEKKNQNKMDRKGSISERLF